MHSPAAISPLRYATWGLLLSSAGCVEPYAPAIIDANINLLVVDGFINGNGRTRIKLSRSVNVGAAKVPAEKGAKLVVADNLGTRYALTETVSGNYRSDSLQLNPARQYQLLLTTAAGVAYASDLAPLKVAPSIDQLTWRLSGEQVQLLLSTHDARQQSRYYRWSLTETWEFHSAYESELEYRNGGLTYRITPIYTCWRTEKPSFIKQASTIQLSQDALTDVQLLALNRRTERFALRYSVLASQYTETAQEFAYYEALRKNTEAVGGVNDPLPTQLTGNVHRLDGSSERVLGFIGAHSVQQQRLFINRQDLPPLPNKAYDTPYKDCSITKAVAGLDFSRPDITAIRIDSSKILISSSACVDCRLRGSNIKPSFW